jgi:putative transcriptional regulator
MTKLGLYLANKSVNQSEVARKTGLSRARVNKLCLDEKTRLEAWELYLILLAIDVDPGEEFKALYKDLKLKTEISSQQS